MGKKFNLLQCNFFLDFFFIMHMHAMCLKLWTEYHE